MDEDKKVKGDPVEAKFGELIGEVDQLMNYENLLDRLDETMRIEGPEKDMWKLLIGTVVALILTVICCFGGWGFLALLPLVVLTFMCISKAITVHDQKSLKEGKSLSVFVTCAAVGIAIALIMAIISGFTHAAAFLWIAILASGIPVLLSYLRMMLYHRVLEKASEGCVKKRKSILRKGDGVKSNYAVVWDDAEEEQTTKEDKNFLMEKRDKN